MSKRILTGFFSLRFSSQLCGIIAAALGILAIMGWLMGWRTLSSIRADYIPMAPNTALSFIVLGISLCALITEKKQGLKLSKIGATVIFVLSLIRFAEFSVNINLNVDRWIFQAPSEKLGLIPVGQMALPTTINFLFASAALFLASSLKKHWIMGGAERLLSVATTLIGLAFSLGYIYSAPLLYGGTTIPMALNTAISFFVLGLGLVINNLNHDIAERKQAAESLRKAHDGLEKRVAERTSELVKANEALQVEIIERSRAEEALRAAAEEWRSTFDSTTDGISIHGSDGNILRANAALGRLLGVQPDEMIGKKCYHLFHNKENPIDDCPMAKSVQQKNTANTEFFEPLLKRWLSVTCSPLFRDKEAIGVVHVVRDVTERKKAEDALIKSKERFRKLVESVTSYIYTVEIKDGKAASTKHGHGCVAVTGYTSEEYEANPYLWYQMVYEGDRDTVMSQANKVLSGDAVKAIEHRIIHKDGTIRWVRNTPVLQYDEQGRVTAYDGLITDVTEHKKLEDQLRQAQKMEAIGQLAGGIAHDFNNILSAIMGFGSLVEMNMKEDDLNRSHIKEILKAGERATHLTQGMLAFSRKQIIDLKPQNLNEIIKGVEKFLRRIIGEDIELKAILTPPPSAPPLKIRGGRGSYVSEEGIGDLTVLADRGQIEQVLMNLAANARDAMPNGGDLIIETKQVALDVEFIKRHGYGEAGIYTLLTVTDSGIGMDEKTRERIFEPFFTTKELGRGTGLGLAMVYGIIKQHDGFINVYSELGKGTTFKIYLPLIKSEIEEKVSVMPAAYPEGGTETVLVAEDDQAVRKLTMNVLERFGYKVIAAEDGEDAVEKFRENKGDIQLLLLDVIMPKKNGKEVYEEIKKINPRIKTIFLSGYTANLIHKKGILEEGINFMLKPVSPKELLKKVREALDR
jgi:two-component system NtrC family sensor kinase